MAKIILFPESKSRNAKNFFTLLKLYGFSSKEGVIGSLESLRIIGFEGLYY